MTTLLNRAFARSFQFTDESVNAVAQQAYAAQCTDLDSLAELASHPALHPATLQLLIARKPKAVIANMLARRAADDPAAAALLCRVESRDGVLAAFVAHTDDDALASLIIGRGRRTRSAIAANRRLPFEVRLAALHRGCDIAEAVQLAGDCTEELLGDDEAWSLIAQDSIWSQRSGPRAETNRLLTLRPQLVNRFDENSPSRLLTVACGLSIFGLTETLRLLDLAFRGAVEHNQPWALLAAVANPRVAASDVVSRLPGLPAKTLHAVQEQLRYRQGRFQVQGLFRDSDRQQLTWLTQRALPGQYHNGRPAEAIALCGHPLLETDRMVASLQSMHLSHPLWASELIVALQSYGAQPAQPQPEPEQGCEPLSESDLDRILGQPTRQGWTSNVAALCQHGTALLGDDIARWEMLWTLLEEFDPDTPLREVLNTAALL